MNGHYDTELSLLIDGDLERSVADEIRRHLATCPDCTKRYEDLLRIKTSARAMTAEIAPSGDVWKGISGRINAKTRSRPRVLPFALPSSSTMFRIAAALVAFIGGTWIALRSPSYGWEVQPIGRATSIDGTVLSSSDRLMQREWLTTGDSSRAVIAIADIGSAMVEPGSRLRILTNRKDERRMELTVGSLRASVWSPPRIFIVETPTAVAVDLGCAYVLSVDSTGSTSLFVTAGEVSLEFHGRVSFVPAEFRCKTKAGFGPGTPLYEDASKELIEAVEAFDFGNGGPEAVREIVLRSTAADAVTLWHLISRVPDGDITAVFDALAAFYPPPQGVDLDGAKRRDSKMLELWLNEFTTRLIPMERISGKDGVTVLP